MKITGAKILLLDEERAERLHPTADVLRSTGVNSIFVFSNAPDNKWSGFNRWKDVVQVNSGGDPREIISRDLQIVPEDNATIIFTSGTYVLTSFPRQTPAF